MAKDVENTWRLSMQGHTRSVSSCCLRFQATIVLSYMMVIMVQIGWFTQKVRIWKYIHNYLKMLLQNFQCKRVHIVLRRAFERQVKKRSSLSLSSTLNLELEESVWKRLRQHQVVFAHNEGNNLSVHASIGRRKVWAVNFAFSYNLAKNNEESD